MASTEVIMMRQVITMRWCMGIPLILLLTCIIALLMFGSLLGQVKKKATRQAFEVAPHELLLEAERPGAQRGIYVVRWLKPSRDDLKHNRIPAKVELIIPQGCRPRWSPQRSYILYERFGQIHVMDRKGNTVSQKGYMRGYPVYGWGPDDNSILVGSDRYLSDGTVGLGFQTFWKEPWETWAEGILTDTIGMPAQYGITFSHPQLPDDLWLGAPTMSPDWSMHAFEAYRPTSDYGRSYSKIYVVRWVNPPSEQFKDRSWLPIWRLTNLPDDLLEVNPKWSPDGKWIAFEVINPKSSTHRVYLASPDGKIVRPIPLPSPDELVHPNPSVQELLRHERMRYYERMRYRVIKWLSKGKRMLIRMEAEQSFIGFWLLDIDKLDVDNINCLKLLTTLINFKLTAISFNERFMVVYDSYAPGVPLNASLRLVDLEEQKGYYVKGFPEDMIVYWMDW